MSHSARPKIVVDDAVALARPLFEPLGEVVCLPGKAISRSDLVDADALIVRSRTQVNAELLADTAVRFVGSTVVGLDHIDQAWLLDQGIAFYSAQGCNARSVAEFVITQILQQAQAYNQPISTMTLGIIGVGHVGQSLHTLATALGMRCRLNDPPKQHQARGDAASAYCDLASALKADVISLHTPLTDQGPWPTRHLLDADALAQLKPEQMLINAARGGVIDEAAWCQAPTGINLIDCWENEPWINAAIYAKASVATPHIAGHAFDAKIRGGLWAAQALAKAWQRPFDSAWQNHLPDAPEPLTVAEASDIQTQLTDLVTQCHDPFQDDLAIRCKEIECVHKKYEYYRRHYPLRREWHAHRVYQTKDSKLNNLLKSLGFSLI